MNGRGSILTKREVLKSLHYRRTPFRFYSATAGEDPGTPVFRIDENRWTRDTIAAVLGVKKDIRVQTFRGEFANEKAGASFLLGRGRVRREAAHHS
jgi:hypothetical protein